MLLVTASTSNGFKGFSAPISDNQFYKPQEFDPQDKSLKFEVCGLALWAWQGKRLF